MNNKLRLIIYLLFVLFISALLFWKCKYGYATLDEAFYPTIAYRFFQGDRILFEEWNNTQLYAVLVMPLLKAYISFNGSTEGIYLFLRYSYTVLKIMISTILYLSMRTKYSERKVFIATVCFLLFAEYGMMVISYNSVAAGGFTLFLMLLYSADETIRGDSCRVLAGVSLSICVLGIPYMAWLYVLFLVVTFVIKKLTAVNAGVRQFYSVRNLKYVTIGVLISAFAFMLYVFSRVSIGQISQTLPYILNGDPAHKHKNLYQLTLAYFVRVVTCNNRNIYILIAYTVIFCTSIYMIVNKKKKECFRYWSIITVIIGICLLLLYITTNNYINDVIFVTNVVAFMIHIYENDSRIVELFWCIWVPGMAFTYFEYIASNTGYSGISASSCVAAIGSVLIILCELENQKSNLKTYVSYSVFISFILVSLVYYRTTYVFWEDGIQSLTTLINGGTADGLLTTQEKAIHYYKIIEETRDISELAEDKRVLFVADKVLWMNYKQRCGSYSPLCYSITSSRNILFDYYDEHPEMVPDVIYVEKTYGEDTIRDITRVLKCSLEEKEVGVILTPNNK